MGIKHFFYWYKNKFGKNIKNLRKGEDFKSSKISIDNLMIDLNGVFHSSTQKVYEYGNYKPLKRLMGKNRKKKMGGLKNQIAVFEDVCSNIENIFRIVRPKKNLILCVDGPAPLAKQQQQRSRRFRSAMEKDEEEFKTFDSNCITPGTKFMDDLTKYIDWYIKKKISTDSYWKNINVIFSSEKVAGEGEHKCINYIRFYGDSSDSFCIHGLDADLIMLALGTHLPKFWILREDLYSNSNDFFILDIGNTSSELANMMNWNEGGNRVKEMPIFNPEYAINDFILLCFMVGNDFLPHIPSLEIIEGGIDYMLDVYKNVCHRYGHLTHYDKGDIIFHKKSVGIFLGTISHYDKGILEDKLMHKDKFFPDPVLESSAKFVEGKYVLDIQKYRNDYYKYNLKDIDLKKLCYDYLEGIQWVLSYYTRGVPDWKWCFKHHYAPFASELAEYISDFNFPVKIETHPTTPFQQLLSVLPPKSSGLIPVPLSQLLTDSTSEIKKFCPNNFDIDISGKRREWEGIVLLPIVDFDVIRKEYFKHIGKVDKRELNRNQLGKSFIYRYNSSKRFVFKSYYGNINNCMVKSDFINI